MRIPIPDALKKIRRDPRALQQLQDFLLNRPRTAEIRVEGKNYVIKRSPATVTLGR